MAAGVPAPLDLDRLREAATSDDGAHALVERRYLRALWHELLRLRATQAREGSPQT